MAPADMTEKNHRGTPSTRVTTATLLVLVSALALHLLLQDLQTVLWIDHLLDWWLETEDSNPYLQGNFAGVEREHRDVPLSVIQGSLPPDLCGLFVRNGANPIPTQTSTNHHWFDGHGMLHTIRFRGNESSASYSNSYIPTPRYIIEKEHKQEVFLKLGQFSSGVGLLKLVFLEGLKRTIFNLTKLQTGQANTHVVMFQNRCYALHEASLPFEVELRDDGSVVVDSSHSGHGFESFDNALNYPVSAHARVDPFTQHLLFHGYGVDREFQARDGYLKVGELSMAPDGMSTLLHYYFGIPPRANQPSYAIPLSHDMVFTPNWLVLYDASVVFDGKQMMRTGEVLAFHKQRSLRFGLVPRRGNNNMASSVQWFDVETPHAVVHPLNAWEEQDGTVVIWLPLGDSFHSELERGLNTFYMTELRLNPRSGSVSKTAIDRMYNVEFSRVRDDCIGSFARFGISAYVEANRTHVEGMFHGFVVWDIELRIVHKVVTYPERAIGGEAVVIPKPGTVQSSGEIYVGSFLYNQHNGKSTFVLYDLETAMDEPVVTLLVPHRVPYGFHGRWVDEAELENHIAYHASRRRTQ